MVPRSSGDRGDSWVRSSKAALKTRRRVGVSSVRNALYNSKGIPSYSGVVPLEVDLMAMTSPSVSGSWTNTLASSAKESDVGATAPEGRAKLCRRPLGLRWFRYVMKG